MLMILMVGTKGRQNGSPLAISAVRYDPKQSTGCGVTWARVKAKKKQAPNKGPRSAKQQPTKFSKVKP